MSNWWPLWGSLAWCPIFKLSHYNSFEDAWSSNELHWSSTELQKLDCLTGHRDSKWVWLAQLRRFITVTSWWARWRLKSPATWLFTQPFIRAQIKKKTPKHRVTGLFTKGQWRRKCFHFMKSSYFIYTLWYIKCRQDFVVLHLAWLHNPY